MWCLVLVLLSVGVSALGTLNGPSLSALDEHTHLDYAWKISHGQVPRAGDTLSPEIREEWACRSQDNLAQLLPACGSSSSAADFPFDAENYNTWHPPVYYAVTGVLARAITALPVDLTFTTAARLLGGAWLAAGLVALFGVLRMWRLPHWLAAAAAALVAGIPGVAHAASTVTNDAPAVLIGAGAAWVLTRVVRDGRTGWALPALVALLAASTKLMNAVAILTVAGVLLLWAVGLWRAGHRPKAYRLLLITGAVVAAVGLVAFGWGALQGARTPAGWTNPIGGTNTAPVHGLPLDEWAPTLMSAFGLVQNYYLQPAVTSTLVVAVVGLLAVLFTAAPLLGLVGFAKGTPERMAGWATLAGTLAVPLLVQVQEFLRGGEYFGIVSSRYAVTLIPLTVITLALVAHRQQWRVASVVVPVVSVGAVVLSFATVF
ncbi:hypothetical protein FE374_14155 [Georgenia yuyongxinii]|uniref:DUF2142 domain-containing protein n=1 Tax=Georgenia yuyongxinii TaxID=2589797 RepID=A0A5B8C8A5_9MICO|nr:hypothetical protein FE374_14155 [Georgenia yuyongxinii]